MRTSALEIDHLVVVVKPGAPEKAILERAGLVESYRRAHPGQGTSNVCYCFDNAYLELAWEVDRAELTSPAIRRTGLAERASWRTSGAAPFGIALRTVPPEGSIPFETWDYRAPFLPSGMVILVAVSSDDPRQPLLFQSPGSKRPDRWTDGRAGARQTAVGLADISGLELIFPEDVEPAEDYRILENSGLLSVKRFGEDHHMVLTLSRAGSTKPIRLSLPEFVWLE